METNPPLIVKEFVNIGVRCPNMEIIINGEKYKEKEHTTLLQLLEKHDLDKDRVAVDLNGILVKNFQFSETELQKGDSIEILHFVGGG